MLIINKGKCEITAQVRYMSAVFLGKFYF